MRESRTEIAVGAIVLVAAAGFLTYALQASGLRAGGTSYEVLASFRSAEGVRVGTDVRMSGVSIGSVAAMTLNTTSFRADTLMRLDAAVPVPDDSTAVIASESLLGGAFIEIFPGGSMGNLTDGAEITDTQGAVSLLQLLVQFAAGATDSGSVP